MVLGCHKIDRREEGNLSLDFCFLRSLDSVTGVAGEEVIFPASWVYTSELVGWFANVLLLNPCSNTKRCVWYPHLAAELTSDSKRWGHLPRVTQLVSVGCKMYALVWLQSLDSSWVRLNKGSDTSDAEAAARPGARDQQKMVTFECAHEMGAGWRCLHEALEFSTFFAEKPLAYITGLTILNCNPHPSNPSLKTLQSILTKCKFSSATEVCLNPLGCSMNPSKFLRVRAAHFNLMEFPAIFCSARIAPSHK